MPERLNGYEVVGQLLVPVGEVASLVRVLLLDKGPSATGQRWVTALHRLGDQEWTWGHYYADRDIALADFLDRCRRGY